MWRVAEKQTAQNKKKETQLENVVSMHNAHANKHRDLLCMYYSTILYVYFVLFLFYVTGVTSIFLCFPIELGQLNRASTKRVPL